MSFSSALSAFGSAVLLLILASCNSADSVTATFYPVDSLLNIQAQLLADENAELKKTAAMGEEVSTASYVPSGVDEWKKELEIFYHINVINKPVNRSTYSVSETTSSENLQVRTFTAKDDGPVRELRVYYRNDVLSPVRIEAELFEDNSMYEGTQQLKMMFNDSDNGTVLNTYSINGGQEMFLADSVKFKITGEITIKR